MNALLPEIKAEFFHNGVPLAGGLVYFYEPGTSTPKTSYADALGAVPNSNPVVLDSQGRASIFINGFYKVVVTTALGTPVYDQDNVSASPFQTLTVSEWITSGVTPTYLSTTTFSVDGDYTGLFQVGRRIRTVDVGGTDYGVVAAAVFATGITTVTVSLDSGSLDSGLASVDVGILSLTNKSLPTEPTVTKTDDYVLAKTDGGKTIIFDKATGVTATLPETSINKVFTVTIASPAVFSSTAHTFSINDAIHFTTTGALPTGLVVGTIYYIISAGFTVDAFQVSTSRGGAAVNTSGTQSGTHTAYRETAAVPNGWKVRLKDLGAGTLTITGTVDGLLNPTLPQTGEMVIYSNGTWFYLDAPTRVRADGALRTFSATPAANSVPVRKSASPYAVADAELAMTGEASAENAGIITLTADTEITIVTLNLGTVTSGDRLFVMAAALVTVSGSTQDKVELTIAKDSGTATMATLHNATRFLKAFFHNNQGGGIESGFRNNVGGVLKITGDGTLVLKFTGRSTAIGRTVPAGEGDIYAFFLKKQ